MKVKRTLCVIMASLTIASSVIGCTSQPEGESQTQGAVSDEKVDFYKKYDPPITLTQGMVCADNIFPEGQSVDNNAYTEWCKNEVGILWKSKWVAPDADTNTQKINLAIASNDLPDIVSVDKSIVSKLAKSGQILQLDDYIDKYSSDLNKYVMQEAQDNENGMLYAPFKYQGGIYGVPSYAHPVDPEYKCRPGSRWA